jgi:type II secretory pathway pseudopilin PulG
MRITGKREVQNRREARGGSVLSTFHLKPSTKRSAFTLIEMIGVMALLTILSTLLVPNIIQKIQEGQRINEDTNLEEIAGALLIGIEREGRFPDPTVAATNSNGWAGIGSKYSVLGTNRFWRVYPGDARNTARRVYLDPNLVTYLGGSYSMPAGGWTNTNPPTSALMYIVSSSKPDLLLSCPTNANLGATDLDWLKNWVKAYTSGGRIAATNTNIIGLIDGTVSRWTNQGQYLHVKIVNVRSLLCEVYLEDWHSPVTNIVLQNPQTDPTPTNTMNPFTSNNFTLSFSGSRWLIQSQPDRNLSSAFTVATGGGMKDAMDVTYNNTNGAVRTVRLTLPASPKFSLNFSTPQIITDLTANPNTRTDSTNFFALKGSILNLFDNTVSNNTQSTIQLKEKRHYHVFSSGVWSQKD